MTSDRYGLEYSQIAFPMDEESVEERVSMIVDAALELRDSSFLLGNLVAIGVMPEDRLKTSEKVLSRVFLSARAKRGTLYIAISTYMGADRNLK